MKVSVIGIEKKLEENWRKRNRQRRAQKVRQPSDETKLKLVKGQAPTSDPRAYNIASIKRATLAAMEDYESDDPADAAMIEKLKQKLSRRASARFVIKTALMFGVNPNLHPK